MAVRIWWKISHFLTFEISHFWEFSHFWENFHLHICNFSNLRNLLHGLSDLATFPAASLHLRTYALPGLCKVCFFSFLRKWFVRVEKFSKMKACQLLNYFTKMRFCWVKTMKINALRLFPDLAWERLYKSHKLGTLPCKIENLMENEKWKTTKQKLVKVSLLAYWSP